MKKMKKILVTLIAVVMFSGCFGSAAFASETAPADTQTIQDTTKAVEATEVTYSSATEAESNEAESTEAESTDANASVEAGAVTGTDISGQAQEETDADTGNAVVEDTKADSKEDAEEDNQDTSKVTQSNKNKDTDKTKKATGTTNGKKPTYTKAELRLLSSLVYAEAGNQSYAGMLGVANVVLNRLKCDEFWYVDTIKEVIYDRRFNIQFSVTIKSRKTGLSPLAKALKFYDTGKYYGRNTLIEKKAMAKAIKAAKAALEGKNNIGSYLCFSNKSCAGYVKRHFKKYRIIEDQIFFRWNN